MKAFRDLTTVFLTMWFAVAWATVGIAEAPATWLLPRGDAGATGAVDTEIPDDLVVLWEHPTAEAIETTPVSDGVRVYVSDVMGGVEALSLNDGSSIWRRDFDTGFVASPSICVPDTVAIAPADSAPRDVSTAAVLVVGDVEGNVYALDSSDGETIWKQTTDGEINASANFFRASPTPQSEPSSGVQVLQTSQDGSLYCFSLATGELVWKYETGDQIRCAASIGNGKTYLGGCDAGLHVIDLQTGKAAREPLSLDGPTGSTPAIIGDEANGEEVYVPIMDGILYSFDPIAGTKRWQYEDPDRAQDYRGSVAIGQDRIVIASRNKQIDAIDRATGQLIWRTTLRRRADASPLIVGDDVWIASTDGLLLRLSLVDGSEEWSFEIKGGFFASPAVLNDRLIIADDEGVVRCFGAGQKPESTR